MAITSHLSVLLLCSILCQVTKKNKFGGFRKIYWAVLELDQIGELDRTEGLNHAGCEHPRSDHY